MIKKNILFPVETINRELDFRLFLAALCARPDNRIIIGQRHVLHDLLREMKNGLYVGQNVRPYKPVAPKPSVERRFRHMKENGFQLAMLDEEGGIMAGGPKQWQAWLDQRLDVHALHSDDHVCTWGNFQREYYRSQEPACKENIVTTGHPRFDLYKPKMRPYFQEDAQRWKEKYGDFVLVNSNFSGANHSFGSEVLFSPRFHYDVKDPQKRLDYVGNWAHVNKVWGNMVRLVTRLSMEMPELNIVVRPHPSENMQFYRHVFDEVPNVFTEHTGAVGPWILASRAVIHDGCTTALEAHFGDVPILNYKSVRDEQFDLMVPNALGERCETEEEVLQAIGRILSGDPAAGKTRALPDVVHTLIDNFKHDAYQQVVDYTLRCADSLPRADSNYDNVLRQHVRGAKLEGHKRNLRAALKPRVSKAFTDRFYGFTNVDLPRKIETVKSIVNRDVNFQVLSWNVITAECNS